VERPLVSIITATYNGRAFLPDLLHKVRASTYDHAEHIIIDDCSTDGTVETLKTLQPQFGFTLIESPVNQGPVGARNQAIAASHGKYILPWDQDNWFSPDYIATMVAAAEKAGENCSPIYSHMILTGERHREILRPKWSRRLTLQQRFVDLGCLFSRRAYDAVGGIDPAAFPISDYELFLGMAVHGFEGKLVEGPRFYYSIRQGSAWDNYRTPEGHARKREVARYIFNKHRARLQGLGHDADALRDGFIQKYYSGPAASLAALASSRFLAEETLKFIPEEVRVVGVDKGDKISQWVRKNIPNMSWIGFDELESTGATIDCLAISTPLNDPRSLLRKRVALLQPGGTLIGSVANAFHWRRLARAFSGQPGQGYACSLAELRSFLERNEFPKFETRAVNAEAGEPTEEFHKFLHASAPLTEALGVDPKEFAERCRITHYIVRAVRAKTHAAAPPPK